MNKQALLSWCVAVPVGLCAISAPAQTSGASPGIASALVPEAVTLEQKVAASDRVFVGTAKRLYFVDRSGREIAAGGAAAPDDGRQAILEVGIEQHLHPASAQKGGTAKIVLAPAPAGQSAPAADGLAGRYLGRQGIYFARRVAGAGTALPLEAAVNLLALVDTPARRGPVENPLPMTELQSVMNATLISGHNTEDPNCF